MQARLAALFLIALTEVACASGERDPEALGGGNAGGASGAGNGAPDGGSTSSFDGPGGGSGTPIECQPCSADFSQVIDCEGNVVETCPEGQQCGAGVCMAPCDAAAANQSSVGCDYYAVTMSTMGGGFGGCFVSFVSNTFDEPVHIQATWNGSTIDLGTHAAIPSGSGPSLTYSPYNPATGLAPGEVAILFLANDPVQHGTWVAPAACPIPAAVGLDAHVHWNLSIDTGRAHGFHITTDKPVVAYQMLPFNAAYATTTGATLLLPTSAWDVNYIAAMAYRSALWQGLEIPPSMAIVAKEDGTEVTLLPKVAIEPGYDVEGGAENQPVTYSMQAGETIELIQNGELTGSPILSNKPIGLFAGHLGLRIPFDMDYSEHAEQQIPPVRALGSEYAVAGYRDRVPGYLENRLHRIVGAVDGTVLTFDPPIANAPATLELGTVAEFASDQPFVVSSQDADHPFMVFSYMSGSGNIANAGGPAGYGDAEFVRSVPGLQYLSHYVFFTDPTYPETNLVIVRRKAKSGFAEVELDCLGTVSGWQNVGDGSRYQYTHVDLSRHDFEPQGACDNGRHEMWSDAPFGLWVWGWGGPETRANESLPCDNTKADNSCDVSYAYPAGENVIPINTVVVPPIPR